MGFSKLIAAAVATIILAKLPASWLYSLLLYYPGAWFYEMGHGLMAVLLEDRFENCWFFPTVPVLPLIAVRCSWDRVVALLVAASGPMGPLWLVLLWFCSRRFKTTQLSLLILESVNSFSCDLGAIAVWIGSNSAAWVTYPWHCVEDTPLGAGVHNSILGVQAVAKYIKLTIYLAVPPDLVYSLTLVKLPSSCYYLVLGWVNGDYFLILYSKACACLSLTLKGVKGILFQSRALLSQNNI